MFVPVGFVDGLPQFRKGVTRLESVYVQYGAQVVRFVYLQLQILSQLSHFVPGNQNGQFFHSVLFLLLIILMVFLPLDLNLLPVCITAL